MDHFLPRCPPPDLVPPIRRDVTGVAGPTKSAVQRGRWRQSTHGFHVPATTAATVEQRILEQAVRLGDTGAVTGWAALRLFGCAYFDGLGRSAGELLPIGLISAHQLRPGLGATCQRRQLRMSDTRVVHGVRCTIPELAIADEVARICSSARMLLRAERRQIAARRRRGDPQLTLSDRELRESVVAIDMVLAAGVTTIAAIHTCLPRLPPRLRDPMAWTLPLITDRSRSPMESRMRLVWLLDAGLPMPECNVAVHSTAGQLLGVPDILDVETGVVGEYDGSAHRDRERHRRDLERLDLFRTHGLECFTVVAGDTREVQVRRMRDARERAARNGRNASWTWTRHEIRDEGHPFRC